MFVLQGCRVELGGSTRKAGVGGGDSSIQGKTEITNKVGGCGHY
jgi:hypothetical protein